MSLDFSLSINHCVHCNRCDEVASFNITHNLNTMAKEAGIYEILWRPEMYDTHRAGDIIEPLKAGIELMEQDPAYFRKFDADNGWGTYDQFMPWLRRVLQACIDYPDATIRVSR